jgi:hypothetical protein
MNLVCTGFDIVSYVYEMMRRKKEMDLQVYQVMW